MTILQEGDQDGPLLEGVMDRFAQQTLWQHLVDLRVEPDLQVIQDWLGTFRPDRMAVLRGFVADLALDIV
jgi:hypothetical protein